MLIRDVKKRRTLICTERGTKCFFVMPGRINWNPPKTIIHSTGRFMFSSLKIQNFLPIILSALRPRSMQIFVLLFIYTYIPKNNCKMIVSATDNYELLTGICTSQRVFTPHESRKSLRPRSQNHCNWYRYRSGIVSLFQAQALFY